MAHSWKAIETSLESRHSKGMPPCDRYGEVYNKQTVSSSPFWRWKPSVAMPIGIPITLFFLQILVNSSLPRWAGGATWRVAVRGGILGAPRNRRRLVRSRPRTVRATSHPAPAQQPPWRTTAGTGLCPPLLSTWAQADRSRYRPSSRRTWPTSRLVSIHLIIHQLWHEIESARYT